MNAEAVADNQHPDHQLRINRWPPERAVERRQFPPQLTEFHEPVDRAQQVVGWNVPFERELIEQSSLLDLPMPHHDSLVLLPAATESANVRRRNCRLFQHNRPK